MPLHKPNDIPEEESSSEESHLKEEESEEETTPKKKSPKEFSPKEDFSKGDVVQEKATESKFDSMIKEKILKLRSQEDGKPFVAPENVNLERMESRYKWLQEQIGEKGIQMKSTKGGFEDCKWLAIGTSKNMKPVFFWSGSPDETFNSPTDIMRAYASENQIEVNPKSIKGWEQSQAFVSKKLKGSRAWLASGSVWPSEYRKGSQSKKTKSEKPQNKKRQRSKNEEEEVVVAKEPKRARIVRAVQYSQSLDDLVVDKKTDRIANDSLLRFQLVRGVVGMSKSEILQMIDYMNQILNSRGKEEEQVVAIVETKEVVEEKPNPKEERTVMEEEPSSMVNSDMI